MNLRNINTHEINKVVDLLRIVFSPDYISRTIYSSSKVHNYLVNLINFPSIQKEHLLLGWWESKKLIGYAHFRAISDSWHLNYVAVHPAHQGQGVGNKLWAAGMALGYEKGYKYVTLDVSLSNTNAIDWYQKLGLSVQSEKWIYSREMNPNPFIDDSKIAEATLTGWEHAEAWQLTYGFSQFHIIFGQQSWAIDRLGTYFRVTRKLTDVVENLLYLIDPSRKLLFCFSQATQEQELNILDCTYRMQGNILSHA